MSAIWNFIVGGACLSFSFVLKNLLCWLGVDVIEANAAMDIKRAE